MRRSLAALALTSAAVVSAANATLASVCTTANDKAALPANGTEFGIIIDASSVTAVPGYNYTVSDATFQPNVSFDYCNVTFAYSHAGKNDRVLLEYWLPSPTNFQNRYLATGGFAYAINSVSNLALGVPYGAVTGMTDGGFGSFDTTFDEVFLDANGTINWDAVYMMGYQAIGEATEIGRLFTSNFYGNGEKVYTYYQGCSEGGREGWSQAMKWGGFYDGIIAGAPAFRYGQQQAQHLYSNVVEQTLNHYPSPCVFEKIVNETIANCDPLDGKTDGVVSRTDLCMLNYNISSIIGQSYSCAPSTSTSLGLGYGKKHKRQMGSTTSTPAQNGTITAEDIAVAQTILDGLHDLSGKRAYISYQPSADFEDAATTYNSSTNTWGLDIAGTGGEWVGRFLELLDEDNLSSLGNVTYDTLRDWMVEGWYRYEDSLQTNNPDLTEIYEGGGKILHFHGESDPSVPAGSSVHYRESVRQIMYPPYESTFSNIIR